MEDAVDAMRGQWAVARPELDTSPVSVVDRVTRLTRLLERETKDFMAARGMEPWEFEMLATLLRADDHVMCMKDLAAAALVSPGALTNRMDHLAGRGLVDRRPAPGNRRMILVTLTPEGERLVSEVVGEHLEHRRALLATLPEKDQEVLAGLLRRLLISLGDTSR